MDEVGVSLDDILLGTLVPVRCPSLAKHVGVRILPRSFKRQALDIVYSRCVELSVQRILEVSQYFGNAASPPEVTADSRESVFAHKSQQTHEVRAHLLEGLINQHLVDLVLRSGQARMVTIPKFVVFSGRRLLHHGKKLLHQQVKSIFRRGIVFG